MAWKSGDRCVPSPHCFLFASGPSSSGTNSSGTGASIDHALSGIHSNATHSTTSGHEDVSARVTRTLTKFEPLPSMEPALNCSSDLGATFVNLKTGRMDVGHYDSNQVGVRYHGPRGGACFNISSVVPYDMSGKYALEEMEVFTIQYE